ARRCLCCCDERRGYADAAVEPELSQDVAAEADGKRSQRVCEGAIQVGNPAAAEYRAEEEHDCADLRGDRAAAGGVSGAWSQCAEADDDQRGGRRDRGASFDGEPRGCEEVCAYIAGCVRAALLFLL